MNRNSEYFTLLADYENIGFQYVTEDFTNVIEHNLTGTAILEEEKLGKQMMGEENSTQEKGRISSQDIPAGTKVEQYTTLKYYISKGQQEITVPDVSGQTGVDAQQTLEDLGLTVTVQKEYSEADDSGWPLTEPGYVMAVSPETGTSMTAGGSVTLTVSRGLDYGDTAQIPDVLVSVAIYCASFWALNCADAS